ncbi:hypothetical protein [Clostridium sp. BSD9I1]|uniref:hypothetical protein n=1 Tax=Clostridium sp. BSD9I1 TaxID=2003589 RepID=UPI00164884A0|nr:hypothetical protein [Clostridium sp. BSD9I1]
MQPIYMIFIIFSMFFIIMIGRETYFIIRYFSYDGIKVKGRFWNNAFWCVFNIGIYSVPIFMGLKSMKYEYKIIIYINLITILFNIVSIFSKGANILINEEGIVYQGKIYPFSKMEYCHIDKTNKLQFKGKNYKDIIKTTSIIEFDINEEDKYEINSLIRGGVKNTNESM